MRMNPTSSSISHSVGFNLSRAVKEGSVFVVNVLDFLGEDIAARDKYNTLVGQE